MYSEKEKEKESASRLEDLDVREVSVVDRPANQRRFLIIKRDDSVTLAMEEEMPTPENTGISTDSNSDLFELLLSGDNVEITAKVADDDDAGLAALEGNEAKTFAGMEEIFKAEHVSEMLGGAQKVLRVLMNAVSALKGLGEKDPTPAIVSQMKAVAEALEMLTGGKEAGGSDKTEKVDANALQAATAALEKLMAVVDKLKGLSGDDTTPPALLSELKAVGKVVASLAAKFAGPAGDSGETDEQMADKDKNNEKDGKVSKGDDPVVVVKVGAKMRQARLSQLRKVVEILSTLLKDLEGSQEKEAKPPVKKADGNDLNAKLAKGFETLEERVASIIAERLSPLQSELSEISKRVETVEAIDNASPGSRGSIDEEELPIEKRKAGFWSNLFT